MARADPLYNAIQTSTIWILFFGVPHGQPWGSPYADYANAVLSLSWIMTNSPRDLLLQFLRVEDQYCLYLINLLHDFELQADSYAIVSFYELQTTSHSGTVVSASIPVS